MTNPFDNLTPEQLAQVANLVESFNQDNQDEASPKKKKRRAEIGKTNAERKEKRENRQPRVTKNRDDLIVEHGAGRKKPRRRIVLDEHEEVQPKQRGRGRSQPRNPRNTRQREDFRRGRGRAKASGVQSRTESVQISGENKFLRMKERNQHKKDVEIDRKLTGKYEFNQRPDEYEDVEVQCRSCNLWFDVNPALLMKDPDDGSILFRCNDCAGSKFGE